MCSLLPLHSYEIQGGFLRMIFFLPKKGLSFVFFLNLPQIFTSESNTKQTNQRDELRWLEHGADGGNDSKVVDLIPVWAIY